ncbi:hypothetical protein Q8A67_024204 [Cirrhinus molitorella]|uniref:Uncharacterized protein n=1 Tax=Cirrhinus molitorella TaxID=172907 RepID=A0AA88NY44_9TELE|nr:hypothetical protein Q8A67_024204 [Cirrhinus molitorella]
MAPHKGRRHYVLFQSSVRAQSADLDITNRDTDAAVKLFLCMTEGGAERQAARPELTLGDTQACPRSARAGMSISTQHASGASLAPPPSERHIDPISKSNGLPPSERQVTYSQANCVCSDRVSA